VEVTFAQPHMQLWSLCPAVTVAVSGMLIIKFVVCSVPMSITGLSADESSSAPALADSVGIFSYLESENGNLRTKTIYIYIHTHMFV